MKDEINVTAKLEGDVISLETDYGPRSNPGGSINSKMTEVVNLKEEVIKKALKGAGWTPPDEAKTIYRVKGAKGPMFFFTLNSPADARRKYLELTGYVADQTTTANLDVATTDEMLTFVKYGA